MRPDRFDLLNGLHLSRFYWAFLFELNRAFWLALVSRHSVLQPWVFAVAINMCALVHVDIEIDLIAELLVL